MIRRPPRSTLDRSSAASDVYKRQFLHHVGGRGPQLDAVFAAAARLVEDLAAGSHATPVSYTHLRAHETVLDLVCRLLLEKKKTRTARTDSHRLERRQRHLC